MRVLVLVNHSPQHIYLVKLNSRDLIDEVTQLINKRKHSKAVATAMSKGLVKSVVDNDEIKDIKAELVLSPSGASWDLT